MTTANVSAVTVSALSTDTAAAPTANVKAEPCQLCGLIGKHELPAEPATCVLCGKKHGEVVKREIPRGNSGKRVLVDRNVAVRHSLVALRQGGLNEDGRFVNPSAKWESQPICDDCAHEMVRAVGSARKAAYGDGAKRADVLDRFPYPRICAISLVTKWVNDENAKEAVQKERFEAKKAANEAARVEDQARRNRIKALILKGARPHRDNSERRGSVPAIPTTVADRTAKNGGKRNDRGGKRAAPAAYVAEVESASEAEVREYLAAQA